MGEVLAITGAKCYYCNQIQTDEAPLTATAVADTPTHLQVAKQPPSLCLSWWLPHLFHYFLPLNKYQMRRRMGF